MSDLNLKQELDRISDEIRGLMIEALSSNKNSIEKASRITCMVEGCHAAIIIAMASFAIFDRDKKKAELLLEKAIDLFAVRMGAGLNEMRKLHPEVAEFIPKATKGMEEMKKDVEDMVKQYG